MKRTVRPSRDYFREFNDLRKELTEKKKGSELTAENVIFELQNESMSLISMAQQELSMTLLDLSFVNESLSELQSKYIDLVHKFEEQRQELAETRSRSL